jgi:transposase-like protein
MLQAKLAYFSYEFKNNRRCVKCGIGGVKKDGKQSGRQRYECPFCEVSFSIQKEGEMKK